MYEELVKRLNAYSAEHECHGGITAEAADAIEKLDTLLDGVSADNEALCETIEMLKKPRWIPVTETNKPKSYEPVMVVYIGWNDALPHRDCTAYWSGDEGLWRWAETNDKVKVSVTHYMPLPPLPEPPKETI